MEPLLVVVATLSLATAALAGSSARRAARRATELARRLASTQAELASANIELVAASLTDALTGLGNRSRLDTDLDAIHARGLRAARRWSIVLFDIVGFKAFNDHFGRMEADETLRRVADVLATNRRRGETAYRYGADVFVLLVPDDGVDAAVIAAERMRTSVEALCLPHPTSHDGQVTVRFGVAGWAPGSPASAAEVLLAADAALLRAKTERAGELHAS